MDRITSLVVDVIDSAIENDLAAKINVYDDKITHDGIFVSAVGRRKEIFSCLAVDRAIERVMNREHPNTDYGHTNWYNEIRPSAATVNKRRAEEKLVKKTFYKYARKAGCPVNSCNAYVRMPVHKRQQARALWLTNLKHVIVEGLI